MLVLCIRGFSVSIVILHICGSVLAIQLTVNVVAQYLLLKNTHV